jgi:hypothetical protein
MAIQPILTTAFATSIYGFAERGIVIALNLPRVWPFSAKMLPIVSGCFEHRRTPARFGSHKNLTYFGSIFGATAELFSGRSRL